MTYLDGLLPMESRDLGRSRDKQKQLYSTIIVAMVTNDEIWHSYTLPKQDLKIYN